MATIQLTVTQRGSDPVSSEPTFFSESDLVNLKASGTGSTFDTPHGPQSLVVVAETPAEILTMINAATVTPGELAIKGVATEGYGSLTLKSITASIVLSGGATEVIPVQVPSGAKIVAAQLRNDTIIVGAGATSYSAAYSTGATQAISAGTAFTKNAKESTFFDSYTEIDVTTDLTDITLTPNAGTLDTGTVTAVVYYYELTDLTSAA